MLALDACLTTYVTCICCRIVSKGTPFSTVLITDFCTNLLYTSGGTADSRSGESPSKGCKAGPRDFNAVLHVHMKKNSMQLLLQSCREYLQHDGNASRPASLAELQGKGLLLQSSFAASGIFWSCASVRLLAAEMQQQHFLFCSILA